MRLFIALNLPESECARIHEAAAPLRETDFPVRWIEPEGFHLTLKFLGGVRAEMLPVLEKVIGRVASETDVFPLGLSGVGAFPTIRRPRVIWMGATPSPALRCLKQDLEWGLASHGFEREVRAFHPHVTLGRVDSDAGAGAFRGLDDLAAGIEYEGVFDLRSIDLMRSQTSKKGSLYSVLDASPLREPPPAEGAEE